MRKIVLAVFILFFLTCNALTLAKAADAERSSFDINAATQELEVFKHRLNNPNANILDIQNAINRIDDLTEKANTCSKTASAKLNLIDELSKSIRINQKTQQTSLGYKNLAEKKAYYEKRYSDCRLFVFDAQEASATLKLAAIKLSSHTLLKRNTPPWEFLNEGKTPPIPEFNFSKFYNGTGLLNLSNANAIILIILLMSCVAIGALIDKLVDHWFETHLTCPDNLKALGKAIKLFATPLLLLGTLFLFFNFCFWQISPTPILQQLTYQLLIYTTIVSLATYFFYPLQGNYTPLEIKKPLAIMLHERLILTATLLLLAYALPLFFEEKNIPVITFEFIQTVFITLIALSMVWFFWVFTYLPTIRHGKFSIALLLRGILIVFLISMLFTIWLGFERLSLFIIKNILVTFVVLGISIGVLWVLRELFELIENEEFTTSQKVRSFFGVRPNKKLHEISLLKISIYIIVITLFIYIIASNWGVTERLAGTFAENLIHGFTLANFAIHPGRILLAVILFAIILLIGRTIAANITRREQFRNKQDTQVAIASIIIYFSFSIALIIALIATGINFTSLAIIAGALSVGIGLGLQGIVNNFASGIILLLERPFKPGDRISIGDKEGIVKRIRVRSTQITTAAKEDIIVPNSDLVTKQITNYMFRDRFWRLTCNVNVAHGNNPELVKSVLLEIATQHPDVVKEGSNAPMVLFKGFDDSNLLFELLCVIQDVNKKLLVTSDLYFAIDAEFKKYRIPLATPQRDVHVNPSSEKK